MLEKKAKGSCNASFGEFLQGVLVGNVSFLVNCPITKKSTVEVLIQPSKSPSKRASNLEPVKDCCLKTDQILKSMLNDYLDNSSYRFKIKSNIPISKGLSSSTADMVAAVRGLEKILSTNFSPEYISEMLTKIEPNDGLHYLGISAYCHKEGRLIANVRDVPSLLILGIDLGGHVDTLEFNKEQHLFSDNEMQEYKVLLKQLLDALSKQDLSTVGKISTESAKRWQKINYKKDLDTLLEIADQTNALGIINTHSGSYIGLFFTPESESIKNADKLLKQYYPAHHIEYFKTATSISGENNG